MNKVIHLFNNIFKIQKINLGIIFMKNNNKLKNITLVRDINYYFKI